MDKATARWLELAFPVRFNDGTECSGMTLRDWFAGQALAGMESRMLEHNLDNAQLKQIARNCYLMADIMMEARE